MGIGQRMSGEPPVSPSEARRFAGAGYSRKEWEEINEELGACEYGDGRLADPDSGEGIAAAKKPDEEAPGRIAD